MRRLRRNPRGDADIWRDLVAGWDNRRWSAGVGFLDAVAAAAAAEEGPILECGSGISTLVLATIARSTGSEIWTLEHNAHWHRVVRSRLRRLRLSAEVQLTPLRDYGDFDWYDIEPAALPTFSLVICDGPPKTTRGGRVGLLPVFGPYLAAGCSILLDDAERADERAILRRWASDVPLRYEIRGDKPYAVIRMLTSGPS